MEKEKQEMMEKKRIGINEIIVAILGCLITVGTILIAIGGIYYETIH